MYQASVLLLLLVKSKSFEEEEEKVLPTSKSRIPYEYDSVGQDLV